MNLQFTLAMRYLGGRKLRTSLTTLAIVFGVLVTFGMNTILPTIARAFQANMIAAAGQVDATITHKTGEAFSPDILNKVSAVSGVRATSGVLERTVNLPADYLDHDPATADRYIALSLVGIDPIQAQTVHAYPITEGRFLDASDSASAVVSKTLADDADLKLGDTLTLPTAKGTTDLIIVGILPQRAIPGNEEVIVTLSQAQFMLDMPGQINAVEADFDTLDKTHRAEIESALQATIGNEFQLQTIPSGSELLNNLYIAEIMMRVLGVMAILMGAFIIFNTFRTIVAERRRDIGMLRAVGAKRSTIIGLILAEGLLQGIVGTVLGLLFGYGFGALAVKLMGVLLQRYINLRIGAPVVDPTLLAGSILIGVGVTVIAGLYPAWSASRVTPIEALRPSVAEVSFKRIAGFGFWAGALLIIVGVIALLTKTVAYIAIGGILFVLGLIFIAPALVRPIANRFGDILALLFAGAGTGQLAEGNLSRQPSRAAVTASTTMIALAILVMASGMLTSASIGFLEVLKKSLGSDYLLLPPSIAVWGSNVGASPQLADDLRAIDGVDAVSTLRFSAAKATGPRGEVTISVLGIHPEDYVKVSGLTFAKGNGDTLALNHGSNVILNGLGASTLGVKVGDQVTLLTPTGEKTYHLIGIANDYLNAKVTTAYVSQDIIKNDFGRTEDIFLQINLKPDADRAAVKAAILRVAASYPQFKVISGQEYVEENMRIFAGIFKGLVVLLLFLAIPSLIAMVNTLAIGVIERTREIGMLRAIGATRSQIRMVIIAEALILAAIGTAFGLLSGLYLAYITVQAMIAAGYPMVYAFPATGAVLAIAAGLIFGVLAAMIPARQAAGMNVVEALRYE
jgi:putative ABC transport system permease protein